MRSCVPGDQYAMRAPCACRLLHPWTFRTTQGAPPPGDASVGALMLRWPHSAKHPHPSIRVHDGFCTVFRSEVPRSCPSMHTRLQRRQALTKSSSNSPKTSVDRACTRGEKVALQAIDPPSLGEPPLFQILYENNLNASAKYSV